MRTTVTLHTCVDTYVRPYELLQGRRVYVYRVCSGDVPLLNRRVPPARKKGIGPVITLGSRSTEDVQRSDLTRGPKRHLGLKGLGPSTNSVGTTT